MSALESLEVVNEGLREMNVRLHLSEVKGPVMDRLRQQHFPKNLSCLVFLLQYEASCALKGDGSALWCAGGKSGQENPVETHRAGE